MTCWVTTSAISSAFAAKLRVKKSANVEPSAHEPVSVPKFRKWPRNDLAICSSKYRIRTAASGSWPVTPCNSSLAPFANAAPAASPERTPFAISRPAAMSASAFEPSGSSRASRGGAV